jgi:hypothetical protein
MWSLKNEVQNEVPAHPVPGAVFKESTVSKFKSKGSDHHKVANLHLYDAWFYLYRITIIIIIIITRVSK